MLIKDNDTAPEDYLCAITSELMRDPVVTSCGHHFEKRALLDWLEFSKRKACPYCNNTLSFPPTAEEVKDDVPLQIEIHQWLSKRTGSMTSSLLSSALSQISISKESSTTSSITSSTIAQNVIMLSPPDEEIQPQQSDTLAESEPKLLESFQVEDKGSYTEITIYPSPASSSSSSNVGTVTESRNRIWYWKDDDAWTVFDKQTCQKFDNDYNNSYQNTTITAGKSNTKYLINFVGLSQTNLSTNNSRQLQRYFSVNDNCSRWDYKDEHGNWKHYDRFLCFAFDGCCSMNLPKLRFFIKNVPYTLDFLRSVQINDNTKTERQVRCSSVQYMLGNGYKPSPVTWRFMGDNKTWVVYGPKEAAILEAAYQKTPKGSISFTASNNQYYTVNFGLMTQTNSQTKNIREIRRGNK